MEQVFEGIRQAITLKTLVMVSLGVFAGITVGAIPGTPSYVPQDRAPQSGSR